jgi:hypothetical protein
LFQCVPHIWNFDIGTECQVRWIPGSYFGGTGFKSQPRDLISCLRFFIFLSLQADAGILPQIKPHQHPFTSLPIYYSPIFPQWNVM